MRALSTAFQNAVRWLAEKPSDAQNFCNPCNLLPPVSGKFNRAGCIVERASLLPTMFASATAAMASNVLGHPVGVGAALAGAKIASTLLGAAAHAGIRRLDRAMNRTQKVLRLQPIPYRASTAPAPVIILVPRRAFA